MQSPHYVARRFLFSSEHSHPQHSCLYSATMHHLQWYVGMHLSFLFKLLRFECCTWPCCDFVNILINCQCISIINPIQV